ncbi:IclR family transcriptional regulator [Paenibacillus mucilaginosus]|uniref:Glycerol operon regulatory protein n=3 Tax=Paenibacillus mucilaginosus TaxID=61624 RepID=H6NSN6_9BACL|nr:IclR family transcriptional regulator [Paenibacillus mucilaginosus]AEI39170.1 regulatory protein IclR [Paenibacillus mucilaginosus KNP414]AFC27457.1 regulatory protein IclR [Paenibacillus mucilaginosus 3016]AFH59604.1 IclR family transcriptional regulator [Paenibacillus mucilaginosus K02]MCG7217281.1 IclR family transcriptional regulator [Paenibacillus mucilaginosus]WDM28185.1 IclR family transcriptional regulator [Paenibacillus mucilaginosus]
MEDGKLTVRAVERALDILLCFTEAEDLSLTEISARVGLHKSTVHRLLASLEGKGFIIRHPATERYRLGFRIWELSANLTHSDDPAVILLPELERLRDQLGETVSLYVRDGLERVRVQAVQSNQAIRRVAPIGARLPLYVGASSKVLVAFADPAEQQALLADPAWPPASDPAAYEQQLAEVRSLGYATSVEEREPGAAAVSVPVFDRAEKLVAALAVSGPSNRLTVELMKEHAPLLMDAARRMGKMLR